MEAEDDKEEHNDEDQFEVIEVADYCKRARSWNIAPNIDKDWECSICKRIMRKPVKLNGISAHTFCEGCIKTWLENHDINPLTGEKIGDNYTLPDNEKIAQEIEKLYRDCCKAKCRKILGVPTGCNMFTYKTPIIPQTFYDENLMHLKAHFEPIAYMTEWAKETVDKYANKPYPSNAENQREQSLSYIDEIEKEMHQDITDRCESAREEVKEADSNDPEIHEEIRERLAEDVGCFKKILNGFVWFFKTLWSGFLLPFRKLGDLFNCIKNGFSNNNDTDNENMNDQLL